MKDHVSEVAVPTAATPKSVYLPGLNGIRAIAALAVVLSHTSFELASFGLNNHIWDRDTTGKPMGLRLAAHGVTMFFTLSGFLISYLALKEKEVSRLQVKAFYIRRLLRIWPLYYLYFFVCLAVIFAFHLPYPASSIPFYIFLAANIPFILGKTLPLLGHYWSLGVEEQFYLFFPQLAKISNRMFLRVAIGGTAFLLLLRGIFLFLRIRYQISLPHLALSVTRFHIMLMGVIAAILYYQGNEKFIRICTHRVTQMLAWLVVVSLAINRFYVPAVDTEVVALVTVCLILGQVTKRNNIINLENKVCDFIGKISYGIYIIHPLLTFGLARCLPPLQPDQPLNYLLVYAAVLALTLTMAYLSYNFYEKRFLKMKSRFAVIKSQNTRGNNETTT